MKKILTILVLSLITTPAYSQTLCKEKYEVTIYLKNKEYIKLKTIDKNIFIHKNDDILNIKIKKYNNCKLEIKNIKKKDNNGTKENV